MCDLTHNISDRRDSPVHSGLLCPTLQPPSLMSSDFTHSKQTICSLEALSARYAQIQAEQPKLQVGPRDSPSACSHRLKAAALGYQHQLDQYKAHLGCI